MLEPRDTLHQDAALLGVRALTEKPFLLWSQFADLHTLLQHSLGQWRVGAQGIIGLDLVAAKIVAEALHIEWSAGLLKKIVQFESLAREYTLGK